MGHEECRSQNTEQRHCPHPPELPWDSAFFNLRSCYPGHYRNFCKNQMKVFSIHGNNVSVWNILEAANTGQWPHVGTGGASAVQAVQAACPVFSSCLTRQGHSSLGSSVSRKSNSCGRSQQLHAHRDHRSGHSVPGPHAAAMSLPQEGDEPSSFRRLFLHKVTPQAMVSTPSLQRLMLKTDTK